MKKILKSFLLILSLVLTLTLIVSKVDRADARYCIGDGCPQSTFTFSYWDAVHKEFPGINTFTVDYTVSTQVHIGNDGYISSLDPVKVTIGDLFISSVGKRPWSVIGPQDRSYIHSGRSNATVDVSFQVKLNNSYCDDIRVVQNVN